jgi:hypothetical protein
MSNPNLVRTDLPSPEPNPAPSLTLEAIVSFAKKEPFLVGGAFFLVIGMLSGGGSNIQAQGNVNSEIRSYRDNQRLQIKTEQISQQFAAERAKLAAARQQNCLWLTTDGNTAANIVEGMAVLDPITKDPLPEGTAVCDKYGWTALLNSSGQMSELIQGAAVQSLQYSANTAPIPAPPPPPEVLYAPATK